MKTRKIIIIFSLIILLIGIIIVIEKKLTKKVFTKDTLKNLQSNSTQKIDYELTDKIYNYKENGNNVLIKYPQFVSSLSEVTSINKLIEDAALNFFEINNEIKQNINIDYTIKLETNSFISIIFKGIANTEFAAHPTNVFYTLNIDIHNNSILKLTDICNIDDDFIELYRNELKKQQDKPEIKKYLEGYTDKELKELLINIDNKESGVYSYYTYDSIGISLPTIYAIGNHFEIEINNNVLKNKLNVWK